MICNSEIAIKVGQNLFQNYQKDGVLGLESCKYQFYAAVQRMLYDCYQKFELPIPELNQDDLVSFAKILDINQDTTISQDDVENQAIKVLSQDENAENKTEVIEYPPIQVKYERQESEIIQTTQQVKETIFDKKNLKQEIQIESVIITQINKSNNQITNDANNPKIVNIQPLAQTNNSSSKFVYPLQNEKIKYEQYNSRTQRRLEVAERLFQQFQHDGYITQNEAGALLQETYKQLNMPYTVTNEDVVSWMFMADKDRDGKVYLKDFQDVLLDSLVQAGINIK